MTTTTAPSPARTTHRAQPAYRLSFLRALRSEWIKIATLRSTWWSIGIVAVLTIGIALLIAQAVNTPGFPGIQVVVSPVQFTMLLAGILGAISVTGEYSTGMIRSTLTADPIRGSVLAAKSIVVAALLFVSSFAVFLVAALAVSPILESKDLAIAWTEPADSIVPIVAASFSMAVFSLIGVAFGFLVRNGAGAIASTVGLLFVLPVVVSIFPYNDPAWQWIRDLGDRLPMQASQYLIMPRTDAGLEWQDALVTLLAWAVVGMLSAWAALRVRDA